MQAISNATGKTPNECVMGGAGIFKGGTSKKGGFACVGGIRYAEVGFPDENGKPLSPERFKLLELMVAHEYIGEDQSLAAPWDSLGAKVADVGGGLGQCINQIVGARLQDPHAIDATSTRRHGGVVSPRPVRSARPRVRRLTG